MYEDFEKCQSDTWKIKYRNADVAHLIGKLCKMYPKKIAFSISFNIEDQVITHIITAHHYPIEIFTLNTGRMFQKIYDVWSETERKYGIEIKPFFPDVKEVEALVLEQSINGSYNSIKNK